jgi:hypothetical protein
MNTNDHHGPLPWQQRLEAVLPFFGHRNWIVVADSAYPAHCAAGVETVLAADDHLMVLQTVLDRLDASLHVNASLHIDAELAAAREEDAPGVSTYRRELDRLLDGRDRFPAIHDRILARVDEAACRFRILIIKTPMRIPYTSVFLELGCRYWPVRAENNLRAVLNGASAKSELGKGLRS